MKKILFLALAAFMSMALLSCSKEGDAVTNTMTVRGQNYKIVHAICANMDGYCHIDLDTQGDGLHGYGGCDASMIGKTTDLKGDFFLSFNPMSGNSIDPVIKSGTCKMTEVKGGINMVVDAVEESGDKFKISVFLQDMGENF